MPREARRLADGAPSTEKVWSIMRCLFSSLPMRANTRPKYPANRGPSRWGWKISTLSCVYFCPISFVTGGGGSANEWCYRAWIQVGRGGLLSSSAVKSLTGKETALTSAVEKYLRVARAMLTFKPSNLNYEVITEQMNGTLKCSSILRRKDTWKSRWIRNIQKKEVKYGTHINSTLSKH